MTYFRKWLIFYYIDLLIDMHSLVHTSDRSISNENKARVILWALRRQNNKDFSLFRLLFCFWLMLGLWSYAYAFAYDDPYLVGLTTFLCFAFCLALILMLMLSCEPGLSQEQKKRRNKEKFSALFCICKSQRINHPLFSYRSCAYAYVASVGIRTFFQKTLCRKTFCRKMFCRTRILPTDILPNGQFNERTF